MQSLTNINIKYLMWCEFICCLNVQAFVFYIERVVGISQKLSVHSAQAASVKVCILVEKVATRKCNWAAAVRNPGTNVHKEDQTTKK